MELSERNLKVPNFELLALHEMIAKGCSLRNPGDMELAKTTRPFMSASHPKLTVRPDQILVTFWHGCKNLDRSGQSGYARANPELFGSSEPRFEERSYVH